MHSSFCFYWNLCLSCHPAEGAHPCKLPGLTRKICPAVKHHQRTTTRLVLAGTGGHLEWFKICRCLNEAAKGGCSGKLWCWSKSSAAGIFLLFEQRDSLWHCGQDLLTLVLVRMGLRVQFLPLKSPKSPMSAEKQTSSELALGVR